MTSFLPRTLRARLLAAFLIPSALFLALSGGTSGIVARQVLEDELGRSLSALAAAAAAQVAADRVLTLEPGDDVKATETRTHRNITLALDELRQQAGLRRIFIIDAENKVRVDVGGGLPIGAEVPELLRDQNELNEAFAGKKAASQVLFEGSDGQLYKSGYAPLRTGMGGEVVAVVGVEGSAQFYSPLQRLTRVLWLWGAIAVVSLAAAALLTAGTLSRPLSRLVDSALRMGRGDLDTAVAPERALEIGILAHELEVMREALRSRDRQLQMMLAGVAHEVRNPIGGIELFAGLLAEELQEEQAEAKGQVKRIQKEIEYLKRMVDDFLAFARESRLAKAELDVRQWVETAVALVEADAEKREVHVETELDPVVLNADESLVTGALVNLLKNALQASPPKSTVKVKGSREGTNYRVVVEDQGPGIKPELRDQIFEPFFTTREQGTGLGLPLAKKIVRAHQGELTLLPAVPGQGAAFALTLPVTR